MSMPKDQIQAEMEKAWRIYVEGLDKSILLLEKDIAEASKMAGVCTDEWCEATEHYIDDIGNALFSISEPRWANPKDSQKIKDLKRKVHDLYANYKQVYASVSR